MAGVRKFIRWFSEISNDDVPRVGGKNASLGEMFQALSTQGVRVPDGFAITAEAYGYLLDATGVRDELRRLIETIKRGDAASLSRQPISFAIRSSAAAEDLPSASFVGQHDSFLNISGDEAVLATCKQCFASLFTERAIQYRINNGFDHFKVALSVGVMKMVRADQAAAFAGRHPRTSQRLRNFW